MWVPSHGMSSFPKWPCLGTSQTGALQARVQYESISYGQLPQSCCTADFSVASMWRFTPCGTRGLQGDSLLYYGPLLGGREFLLCLEHLLPSFGTHLGGCKAPPSFCLQFFPFSQRCKQHQSWLSSGSSGFLLKPAGAGSVLTWGSYWILLTEAAPSCHIHFSSVVWIDCRPLSYAVMSFLPQIWSLLPCQ